MKLTTMIILVASTLGTSWGCEDNQFECTVNGLCIPIIRVCDGIADCVDATDEMNCPATTTPGTTRCPEFECNNGPCIPARYVCDNDRDCPEGEDELNCPPTTRAPCTGFTCQNGLCIPSIWKCDGNVDCSEGEDEANCSKPSNAN